MYSITLQRKIPQKPRVSLKKQLNYLTHVALRGNRGTTQGWVLLKQEINDKILQNGNLLFTATLIFEKTRGRQDVAEIQWNKIITMLEKAGKSTKFNKYPWLIADLDITDDEVESKQLLAQEMNGKIVTVPGVQDICVPSKVKTLEDLKAVFPYALLGPNSDQEIENHPVFREIYGRGPQIRSCLSSIKSFIETNGERANNTLLWGLPATCKTQILLAIEKTFGEGSVLRLDATSCTKAGVEKLFFKDLQIVPPIIIMEEIEKAEEPTLRIWLGAMDDRHEIRKVNFHMSQVRKVYFLAMATANDKVKFDFLMGGRPNHPGALSSRFKHQYECPRPTEDILKKILQRDINKFGGKFEWVEPILQLARELNTDDPRKVLAFLDGGDRLLDNSYRKDMLAIHKG